MQDQKKYALISVSDKQGVTGFAQGLIRHGFEIISTGGTAKHLQAGGLVVHDSEEFTGIGSILEDRVKTLCPQIHGGLLAVEHMREEFERLKYPFIDLFCGNLYPLEQTIASGAPPEKVLENTDIGGIALLRSAAKGRRIIASSPEDYEHILAWMDAGGPRSDQFRLIMALKAETIAHGYCRASARHLKTLTRIETYWEQELRDAATRLLGG